MAKTVPSGSGLPACWNKDMDRFICECEAIGTVDTPWAIKGLKKKFPELLGNVVLSVEAIERRVECLDLMDNDYFVKGVETAIERLRELGIELPPMDLEKYSKKQEGTGNAEGATETGAGESSGAGGYGAGMVGVKIVHDEDGVGASPRGETNGGESFDLHEALKENYAPNTRATAATGSNNLPNSVSTGTFGYEYNPPDNAQYSTANPRTSNYAAPGLGLKDDSSYALNVPPPPTGASAKGSVRDGRAGMAQGSGMVCDTSSGSKGSGRAGKTQASGLARDASSGSKEIPGSRGVSPRTGGPPTPAK